MDGENNYQIVGHSLDGDDLWVMMENLSKDDAEFICNEFGYLYTDKDKSWEMRVEAA